MTGDALHDAQRQILVSAHKILERLLRQFHLHGQPIEVLAAGRDRRPQPLSNGHGRRPPLAFLFADHATLKGFELFAGLYRRALRGIDGKANRIGVDVDDEDRNFVPDQHAFMTPARQNDHC